MLDWNDPRLHAALEEIVGRYVRDLIAKAVPSKSYGRVKLIGEDDTVWLADEDGEVFLSAVPFGDHVPVLDQLVRALQWPDGDAYIDGAVGGEAGGFAGPLGQVPEIAALPTATAELAGQLYRVPGGVGVADETWVCQKNAADEWVWQQLILC